MKHALLALLFAASTACAQIKISELPAASTLTGTEATMVTQGGVSKKATITQINAFTLTSTGTLTGKTISGADNTFSNVAFSALTGLPTTLAGYGITDGLLAATAASTYATIVNLALKAPIDSPTFTGTVTGPTFVGALTGNALTVTTNANLTGPVTSVGNATAIANGAISNAMLANGAVANLSGTNTGDQSLAAYLTSATAASTYATIASLGSAAFLAASPDAAFEAVASYDEAGRLRTTSINLKDGGFEAALRADSLTANVGYLLPSQAEDGLRLLTTGGNGANLTALNASNLSSGTVPTARLGSGTANSTTYLRGDQTWQTLSSGITIGTTTSNGTAGRVLYTDGNNVQAYPVTGSGSAVLGTSPTITGLAPSSITGTAAIIGTNTFTGAQINSTAGAASAPSHHLTGAIYSGGTGTTNLPHFLIQPSGATASTSLSTSGTALGINLDVNAGNLIDGGVDGVSTFKVSAAGQVTISSNLIAAGGYIRAGNFYANSTSNVLELFTNSGIVSIGSSEIVNLNRDANYTLGIKNGTNPMLLKIYNTYTSATSYERAAIEWVSNVLRVGTQKGSGGGTARDMILISDDTERVRINSSAVTLAAGLPLAVASGSNQRAGDATLVSGTVTVSNTTVTANTRVFITRKTSGGTIGMALTYTVSAATSFTINSDNVLDTSVVSYLLVEVP